MSNLSEMISLAKTSTSEKILRELSKSYNIQVRRATARNISTPNDVLNYLAMDVVLNVSYMASLNPKCTVKREFNKKDALTKCVVCEEDERYIKCPECLK